MLAAVRRKVTDEYGLIVIAVSFAGVLAELDASVERCLQVRGGISTQYFYRSMYAVQLYHCFKVRVVSAKNWSFQYHS